MRRLTTIRITELLGRQDEVIEVSIPKDWEFAILHGPNGVGKTKLLEIIANTFAFRPRVLADIPFSSALFAFDDGARLEINRRSDPHLPLDIESNDETDSAELPLLQYALSGYVDELVTWELTARERALRPNLVREIERFLPVARVGADLWVDHRTSEYMTFDELVDRYADELPRQTSLKNGLPDALKAFLDSVRIHLIETQRLLRFERAHGPQPGIRQRATVEQFAKDLTRRIGDALAQNSRTSQQLDRTFPQRILEATRAVDIGDDEIRQKYQQQTDRRNSLSDIAVLDPFGDLPLPQRDLERWERRVLWQWLEDSDRKLATFQWLLDRATLMKQLVNARFTAKELRIDADKGFRFVTDRGQELAPHQLSSGEQHEIVLLYDLLFNVQPTSIVLVDEPEISLHIGWQQEFLNDIKRVADLADLQFIIATHSPQIVNRWSERMVPLRPGTSAQAS